MLLFYIKKRNPGMNYGVYKYCNSKYNVQSTVLHNIKSFVTKLI